MFGELTQIQCPYCWESFGLQIFPEDGLNQDMIIDCEVCCHPMNLIVNFEDESSEPSIEILNTEGGGF